MEPMPNELAPALLRCVECGVVSTGQARGWQALFVEDDEVDTWCPDCARREFGDDGDA